MQLTLRGTRNATLEVTMLEQQLTIRDVLMGVRVDDVTNRGIDLSRVT